MQMPAAIADGDVECYLPGMRLAQSVLLLLLVLPGCDACGYRSSPVRAVDSGLPDAQAERWSYDEGSDAQSPKLVCSGLPPWDSADAEHEEQLFEAVNRERTGGPCGLPSASAAMRNASVRCAAREVALEIDATGSTAVTPGDAIDWEYLDLLTRWGHHTAGGGRAFATAETAEEAVAIWAADDSPEGACNAVLSGGWPFLGTGVRGTTWVAFEAMLAYEN